jgi:hypothetical protein
MAEIQASMDQRLNSMPPSQRQQYTELISEQQQLQVSRPAAARCQPARCTLAASWDSAPATACHVLLGPCAGEVPVCPGPTQETRAAKLWWPFMNSTPLAHSKNVYTCMYMYI